MIKATLKLGVALATLTVVNAQPLRFTSGVVSNFSNVTLTLQGPSNQVCRVERLSRSNQVWQSVGNVTLNAGGSATFYTTLDEGVYGFYRAKTTNGAYLSTNAFGAVVGTVYPGWNMVGNPFGSALASGIFLEPVDLTTVYKFVTNSYVISTYFGGAWYPDVTVGLCEGVLVNAPTNRTQRYLVTGLFGTNSITRPIASDLSILCSPRYQLAVPAQWQVDQLDTNRLGGYSAIPVQTPGRNPQCEVSRMIDLAGSYQTFTLTTNNVWQSGGTNTVVPLELTEGFWIDKPTNATWYVRRAIW
jgi:hypothetical protein